MAGRSRSKGRLLVPGASKAIDQWKYEIAAELGIPVGHPMNAGMDTEFGSELGTLSAGSSGRQYLGDITSRDAGTIGGGITRRLIQQAEQVLRNS